MFAPKPSKIRQRTVTVPIKKTSAPSAEPGRSSSQVKNSARSVSSNGTSNGTRAPAAAVPGSRFQLTPANKSRAPTSSSSRSDRRTLTVTHQRKRKASPSTPQWASSDESSDSDGNDDRLGSGGRKRQKTSSSIEPAGLGRSLEPDLRRRIRYQVPPKNGKDVAAADKDVQKTRLIHGVEMTRGRYAKLFQPAFSGSKEIMVAELQYPSRSRPEKFEVVVPKGENTEDYNPLSDLYYSMEEIINHYLPVDIAEKLSSEVDGPVRLLKRAVTKNSKSDFKDALADFNNVIVSKLADKTIQGVLDDMHAIPLSLTKCILGQVYQRTVSPEAHKLRRVRDKKTTYGELMPAFVHTIFHQTHLNSESVFVDLGSGVGNVVMQSALQTGAESWGIEIMDIPSKCAEEQAVELRARSKLWNLSLGAINLLHGDFLESPEIDEVLKRADVVLVNNKVFPQRLNEQLLYKFLELKNGCKVVSLNSFGGGGKQGARNENSIANIFDEERFDSGTGSVSWMGDSVEYFIATKVR